MTKQVREEAQLVYSIGASSAPATTYPGFGAFSASATTDPHKASALAAKLTSMWEEFAKNGPSDDEVVIAKKQFQTGWTETIKQPAFWSGQLSQITFRGRTLILTGLTADNCVLFTASDAYLRDFEIVVPSDCVASIDPGHTAQALEHMHRVLKADVSASPTLILSRGRRDAHRV